MNEKEMAMRQAEAMVNIAVDSYMNDQSSLRQQMTKEQQRRRDAGLKHKELSGNFTDYLTDLEGSDCEILDHTDINVMPFKFQGVDLDQFKRDCEEIDEGYDKKYVDGYMDGHSDGMAAGFNFGGEDND